MPPRKPTAQIPTRVAVLVKHATDINTAIPTVVWQHEVPILEAIHGEGKVEEIPNAKLNEHFREKAAANLLIHNKAQDRFIPPADALGVGFVFTGDLEAEYNRLIGVYGRHMEINTSMVEYVYGRFQGGRFQELLAAGTVDDMPPAQLRQVIRGYGWLPITDKDSTLEERQEAAAKLKELTESPRERLLEIAHELEEAFA